MLLFSGGMSSSSSKSEDGSDESLSKRATKVIFKGQCHKTMISTEYLNEILIHGLKI
jgi:hypothetical protein